MKPEIVGDTPIDKVPSDTLHATNYILSFNSFLMPEQFRNLEFVQLFSAGANHLFDRPLWKWEPREVKSWRSASGVHRPIIGEYVVMAMLTPFHTYITAIESCQGAGGWPEKWPRQCLDSGKCGDKLWRLWAMGQLDGM